MVKQRGLGQSNQKELTQKGNEHKEEKQSPRAEQQAQHSKQSGVLLGPARFRSNFVHSLHAWHPKCYKSSRSRSQRSRSQRDIMCAKIRKIINNSAGNCSISLKFRTDFDHVTLSVPRTFKINQSKVKVTAQHNVLAAETLAKRNMLHGI